MTKRKQKEGAAIFDFDGTLIDSFTPRNFAHVKVCEFLLRYIRDKGYKTNKKLMLELISKIEKEMNEKKIYNRNFWWREVLKRYLGKVIQISLSVLTEASFNYWETVKNKSLVYPEVKDVLHSLKQKGIILGLISDTDGLNGMKLRRITESGLQEFFDAIVIAGEDTSEVKPSTQPFIRICELLEVIPENCVFVGDNPEVDILGPKELGMKTIIIGDNLTHFQRKTLCLDYFLERGKLEKLEELISKILRENGE